MPFATKTVTITAPGSAEISTEGISEEVLVSIEKVSGEAGTLLYFVGGAVEAGSTDESIVINPTTAETVVTPVFNHPVIKCTQAGTADIIFKISERILDTDD